MQIKILKIYTTPYDLSCDDYINIIRLHTVHEVTDFEECSEEDHTYVTNYIDKYNHKHGYSGYQYIIVYKDSPAFVKTTVAEAKRQMMLEEQKRIEAQKEEQKRKHEAQQKKLLKKKESLLKQLARLNETENDSSSAI